MNSGPAAVLNVGEVVSDDHATVAPGSVTGPLSALDCLLSDGAFETFKSEALVDGGVDRADAPSDTVPPLVPAMLAMARKVND